MGRYRVQQKLKCKQGTEGEHSFGWVYHKRPRCIVLRMINFVGNWTKHVVAGENRMNQGVPVRKARGQFDEWGFVLDAWPKGGWG